MIKRITWKNDSYVASDKQIAFINSLLEDIKTQMVVGAAGSFVDRTNEFQNAVYEFWQSAKLPENVTKTEASGLIDTLKLIKNHDAANHRQQQAVAVITMKLAKNQTVNSQTPDVMLNVFADALNSTVVQVLKKFGKI